MHLLSGEDCGQVKSRVCNSAVQIQQTVTSRSSFFLLLKQGWLFLVKWNRWNGAMGKRSLDHTVLQWYPSLMQGEPYCWVEWDGGLRQPILSVLVERKVFIIEVIKFIPWYCPIKSICTPPPKWPKWPVLTSLNFDVRTSTFFFFFTDPALLQCTFKNKN